MNKLRKIFYPSEEKINIFNKQLQKIKEKAIEEKQCTVCKHYSYNKNIPGFITYEGDCNLNLIPFFKRDIPCINWERGEEYNEF